MTQIHIKIKKNEIIAQDITPEQADKLIDAFVEHIKLRNNIFLVKNSGTTVRPCEICNEDTCDNCDWADNNEHDEHDHHTSSVDKTNVYYMPSVDNDREVVYKEVDHFGVNIGDKLREATQKKLSAIVKPKKQLHEDVEIKEAKEKESYMEHQDYYVTGIKYRLIKGVQTATYRCRYQCPNPHCNERGNHYIPEGSTYVYCHNCNTKMKVQPSTDLGFPHRDDWGNYYIAYEEFE